MPNLIVVLLALLITSVASQTYTNHTVGGSTGWFFSPTTNTSSVDYSKWAANQTFNLGDFLIFNTNSNQSVIQTYNVTTYRSCNTDDALDTDTLVYSAGDKVMNALTFSVPLTIEGDNYFFSDADDGVQCIEGMAFQIVVKHGFGLPPSLNQPPPPPYVEPPSTSESPPSNSDAQDNQQETFHSSGFRCATGVYMLTWISLLVVVKHGIWS